MLWWEETDGAVNTLAIETISALVLTLIPHGGGLPVDHIFLRRMVVSLLGNPCTLTIIFLCIQLPIVSF